MQERTDVLISFITPVYNVQKYLRACLDSLSAQTGSDIEFVLIDDGSTDESVSILDEFASHDSRATVVHQQNGGVSQARNVALGVCSGRWLCFVDADDVVSSNLVLRARPFLTDSLDVLFFSWNKFSRDDQKDIFEDIPTGDKILTSDELHTLRLTALCPSGSMYKTAMRFRGSRGVYGYIARADIIMRENIRFEIGMRLAEDVVFRLKYLSFCHNAACISDVLYHYRIQTASLLHRYSERVLADIERATCELGKVVNQYYGGDPSMKSRYFAAVVLESRLYFEKYLFNERCPLSYNDKLIAYVEFRNSDTLKTSINNCDRRDLQNPVNLLLDAYRVNDAEDSMRRARAALKRTASPIKRILSYLGLTVIIKKFMMK